MRNVLICCALISSLVAAHASGASAQTSVRFAVIGDYGLAGTPAADVAALVKSWNPDLIITTGDNNYYYGAASTIDINIGQYYAGFIHPYRGQYGPGGTVNRFFPSLGNHDWEAPGAQPYLDYFTLPGNERYYDFVWGPVHFFALNSDPLEPDGRAAHSLQGQWLHARLTASTAPWKIVYMHHPPQSSAHHGSSVTMQWPYETWGASAVMAGHDHAYERVTLEHFPYFVNGLGGAARYEFHTPLPGSQVRFQSDYGAMRVEATAERITFEFVTRAGVLIDRYTLYTAPDDHLPDAPGNLTAIAVSGSEIDLGWSDNSSNETSFRIEQWTGSAWAMVGPLAANAMTYRVGALDPVTSYSFRVVARGAAGDSAPSPPATATTLMGGPPAAPSGLAAQVVSSGRIDLTWVDGSVNEAGFTVEQSLDGATFASVAALDRNAQGHPVAGLTPDVTYFHRVRAFNGDGVSAYSNTVSARTGPPAELVVYEVFNPPATAVPGGSFGAREGIRNEGPGGAGPSVTRYYLSLDGVRDPADILLEGSRLPVALAPGQTSKGTVSVAVPTSTPPGLYHLIACADDTDQVVEVNETNNCRASLTRVQVGSAAATVPLTVTLSGSGSGSVSGPGIACGTDCSESYSPGAAVTLTAAPAASSTFSGWSGGGCGTANPCSTVISAAVTIVASFSPAPPGDLVVTSLGNPPGTAAPGASFLTSDIVANSGPSLVVGSTVRYYVSPDGARGPAAVLLGGTRLVGSLAAAATSPGGASVTLPSPLAAGPYYLLACADDLGQVSESNETNNCRAASGILQVTASPPPPPPPASGADLVVSEVFNPPGSASAGGSFGARDSVLNRGSAAAGPSVTRYHLSLDLAWDPADILLGGSRAVVGLLPGQINKGSVSVTVPGTVPAGLYYLLACADDTNQVGEPDEANNCRASQARVQIGSAAATVLLTVTLSGSGSGSVSGPGIACGTDCSESYSPGAAVTLTAAPAASSTFSGWSGGGCGTANPCSTVISAAVTIVASFSPAPPGDLVVTSLGNPPGTAAPGASFLTSDIVANSGPSLVAGSTVRYYVSPDGTRGPAAVLLGGTRLVGSLAAAATSPGGTSVTLPSPLAAGPYYLLACADDLGQVSESNETNNCRAASGILQVTASPPPPPPPASGADLVVSEMFNPPGSASAGGSFGARDWVLNQGSSTAGPSVTRFYLSFDLVRDPADILLGGSRAVGTISAGQTSKGSITVVLPSSTPSGLYYLLACADDTNQVGEPDEINNCRVSQTRVQVGSP